MKSAPTHPDVLHPFTFNTTTPRVIFGAGALENLPDEVEKLGLKRVVIVSTSRQREFAENLASNLGSHASAIFSNATMHTPTHVTDEAMQLVTLHQIDGIVAVGGGSTTGLAKAIALRTGLPQIVAPTTYAGSEMTAIIGETQNGLKVTKSDPRILPRVVIYDPNLTLDLPLQTSLTSAMNAIAHAVEALYAHDRNPVISLLAEEGIRALANALPILMKNGKDHASRTQALYGAWLCGIALGSVGMAIHHKLCHTLGGTFNLPHAETHTVLLPHAAAFNSADAPEAMRQIARAIGSEHAATGLYDLAHNLGANMALRDLGMPESGIDVAADLAMKNAYSNPRPLDRESVRKIIADAWSGYRP
ncbi:maleylacetate reductase [Pseudomonas alvandae]|uniref:maleylacetate reductase n=1 Tax=Pseudomonas canavaninivorans TaxID=2842348 RepID=UPI002B1DB744|nr:maleylacetate reductase [Pseudomonas canavaninivorans]